MITFLATKRPNYDIVLIGPNYDGSIGEHNIKRFKNLHVLGPKNYTDLPSYLYYFDVAIIPFKINKITQSTSPIKLFEYMAGGKPIVTTALHECKKYKSVLWAKEYEEFVSQIDRALLLKQDHYCQSILKQEALANTWDTRVESIVHNLNLVLEKKGAIKT